MIALFFIFGYCAVRISQDALEAAIKNHHILMTAQIMDKLDFEMDRDCDFLRMLANDNSLRTALHKSNREFENLPDRDDYINAKDTAWIAGEEKETNDFILPLIQSYISGRLREETKTYNEVLGEKIFGELFVTNKYGAIAALTNRTSDYRQNDEQWWQEAHANGVFFSDISYDESAGMYTVSISLRITDPNGAFLGVLKGVINIDRIFTIIKNIRKTIPSKTIHFKLLTRNDNRFFAIYKIVRAETLPKKLRDRLTGASGSFISYDKQRKGQEFFTYASSPRKAGYTGVGWSLLTEETVNEIFAPAIRLRRYVVVSCIGIALIALFFSFIFTKKMTGIIALFKNIAFEIGTGNLEKRIPIHGKDEIGQLARLFNQMVENLQKSTTSITRLQEEIALRKEAEHTLQAANYDLAAKQKELENILAAISHPFYVVNSDHTIALMNPAAQELADAAPEWPLHCYNLSHRSGKPCSSLEHPCPLAAVKKTKKPVVVEHVHLDKHGNQRIIEVYAFPLFDANGTVVQMVESCIDITERKMAERELARAKKNLQNVLDSMPIGVLLISRNKEILTANKAALRLSGYDSVDELLNKKCHATLCPADAQRCPILDEGKKIDSSEKILVTKNGGKIPILKSIVPVTIDNEALLLETFIDITEYKKAEAERLRLEKELIRSQRLESIGTLAAGVAHEINTPIQFIGDNTRFVEDALKSLCTLVHEYQDLFTALPGDRNYDTFIENGKNIIKKVDFEFLESEIPNALQQTQEGIDQVVKIVSAMKDFSHVGTENMQEEDINRAIKTVVTISRNEWKYIADIEMTLAEPLPLVFCFIGSIKQVLLNLIVNAAHSIADALKLRGEGKGTIKIATYTKEKNVIIAVSDTGVGIPEKIRDQVFDPFFTTKEVGKGTGQGLSMAYQTIVEKHNGKLWFETETGKGTTFFISLPL